MGLLSKFAHREALRYLRRQLDQMAEWLLAKWRDGGWPRNVDALKADLRAALEHALKHGSP